MKQYINLYRGLETKPVSVVGSRGLLVALCVAALALAGWAVLQQRNLNRLQAEADQVAVQAGATHESLAALTKRVAQQQAGLAADATIAGLESRLQARERILAALDAGALGKGDGFAAYLRALARCSGRGIWLTAFTVGQGGASMSLSGRALEAERIPSYLERLNAEKIFQGRGFAGMRVRQLADSKEQKGGGADGKPPSVEFSIGTGSDDKPSAPSPTTYGEASVK